MQNQTQYIINDKNYFVENDFFAWNQQAQKYLTIENRRKDSTESSIR